MTEPAARRGKIRERIRAIAFDLLEQNASGLRFSELQRQIQLVDPKLKPSTINTSIWNLDTVFPERVHKPSKGLFRLAQFRQCDLEETPQAVTSPRPKPRIREEAFYPLFASWLKNELEDVTHAIALGRNVFKDRKRPANPILDRQRGMSLTLRRWCRRRAANDAAATPRSGWPCGSAAGSGHP